MANEKIQKAGQQFWNLSGSDYPDITEIEAKVCAVAKLRAELVSSSSPAASVGPGRRVSLR
jgi:hypothetical protein